MYSRPSINTNLSTSICQGNTYTLPGGTIVSTTGTYIDTLLSISGCDSIITTSLTVHATASSIQNISICSGNNHTLPNGGIVNASGVYRDTLVSHKGCDSIITTNLTVNPLPTVSLSPNTTIILGESTLLTATGLGTFSWAPSIGLDSTTGNTVNASPSTTTTYCVVLTNSYGCTDTACVTVNVESDCFDQENLKVPNAFSPNGDNTNDEFCLQGWDKCIKNFTIVIFNRWGEKVFESKDPNFCWNGWYNNEPLDPQVFVYYITATHITNKEEMVVTGNISLIR